MACAGRSRISRPRAHRPPWRSARRCALSRPAAQTPSSPAAPKPCSPPERSRPRRRCARSPPPAPRAPPEASDAAASCKPFDKRRSGLVLGEGAAAFVLEDYARARERGAPILALLTGYGNSCDAVHMSRPDREGQVRAMREALAESRLAPGTIGYINAHGTATSVGDVVEAEAINAVFGDAAARVPVSSTKSLHGHLLGGAGALEFAAALLPLMRGWLPPTAFLEQPDPACALRHVPLRAERADPPRA